MKRIGFACKFSTLDSKKGIVSIPELNAKSTSISWLNTQVRPAVAEEKLWYLMKYNINATLKAVKKIGELHESLRCFRISSDILPAYTHPTWSYFYSLEGVCKFAEREFAKIGDAARQHNVRLSFHPGQFCCIVSDNADVVNRSLEELEYHADMVRWMGYGQTKLDFKINVHLSGKQGVDGFDAAWQRMSPELQNCLTLENDEYQTGIDTLLQLKDKVGIVLDLHHHWIHTGEYIQANDPCISQIIDSWQGVRPIIHYSVSREDLLLGTDTSVLPNMQELLAQGFKKQKLRAHSDYYWNTEANAWALTFWDQFDIMAESKAKNLASFRLFEYAKTCNLVN
jgi:UV damage endonuclease UvdE